MSRKRKIKNGLIRTGVASYLTTGALMAADMISKVSQSSAATELTRKQVVQQVGGYAGLIFFTASAGIMGAKLFYDAYKDFRGSPIQEEPKSYHLRELFETK